MKRNRTFQGLVLFVIIAFAFTTIGFFAIQESYAHQLCSGCPTEDSGETYCYDCNSEHNHLQEAIDALDSAIGSARSLITSAYDLAYDVESSAPSDVAGEIGAGLRDIAVSLGGAVVTALAAKATLASAGTLSVPAYAAITYSLSLSYESGYNGFQHFSNAWSTWQYHNAEVSCPQCERPTTQAALDGNSLNTTHMFITCPFRVNDGSNCYLGDHDLSLRGVYRNCRGSCPNSANHYNTEN